MADNKKEKIGVQDIAKVLSISASTVSRALNDHPRISKDTKDKVRQVAKRLGYFPGIQEQVTPQKAEKVVVLAPSLEYAFYREVIAGVRDFFNKHNYIVFIADANRGEDFISSFFSTYKKYGVSGIIHIICNRNIPKDFYSTPLKDMTPVVSVFEPDNETGVSSVLPDLFHGIYKSVKYLKSMNIEKVALFLENRDKPDDHQILSSFESAFESMGIDLSNLSVRYREQGTGSVGSIFEKMLKENNLPEVVFVKNVMAIFEVENETKRLGIKIPEDMLLVTIDTGSGTKRMTSSMSLLKLPAYDMGHKAASMLMHQIKNPGTDKKTAIVPVNFILKGSSMRIK